MANKFKILILLLLINMILTLKADSIPKYRIEPFFNISNALIRFSGNLNNNNIINESPYLLGAKLRNKKNNAAWRLGADFNVSLTDESFNTFNRTTRESFYLLTIGREWRKKISNQFEVYLGSDVKYFEESNVTSIFDFFSGTNAQSVIKKRLNGPGAGVVFGFTWNITSRISLFTEGSLNFFGLNNYQYTQNASGFKSVISDKIEYVLNPLPPNALFFLIKI